MIYAPARRANAPRYWRTYATFLYQRLIPCSGRMDHCYATGRQSSLAYAKATVSLGEMQALMVATRL